MTDPLLFLLLAPPALVIGLALLDALLAPYVDRLIEWLER